MTDLLEAIQGRRSIRKYLPQPVSSELVERGFGCCWMGSVSTQLSTVAIHHFRQFIS